MSRSSSSSASAISSASSLPAPLPASNSVRTSSRSRTPAVTGVCAVPLESAALRTAPFHRTSSDGSRRRRPASKNCVHVRSDAGRPQLCRGTASRRRRAASPARPFATSSSWRRASFTCPDQSSSSPRWKRTVAACGNVRGERPEPRERLRRPSLVEEPDGRGDPRLGIGRREPRRARRTRARPRAAARAAAARRRRRGDRRPSRSALDARAARELGRRRRACGRPRASFATGTKIGRFRANSGWRRLPAVTA